LADPPIASISAYLHVASITLDPASLPRMVSPCKFIVEELGMYSLTVPVVLTLATAYIAQPAVAAVDSRVGEPAVNLLDQASLDQNHGARHIAGQSSPVRLAQAGMGSSTTTPLGGSSGSVGGGSGGTGAGFGTSVGPSSGSAGAPSGTNGAQSGSMGGFNSSAGTSGSDASGLGGNLG
jgi:hypothetical protein